MKLCLTILIFILGTFAAKLCAQPLQIDSTKIEDSVNVNKKEVVTKPFYEIVKDEPILSEDFEMEKSPTTALFYSLTFPGAGQIYVESYWKAPIFVGASSALIYFIVVNHNEFVDLQAEWKKMSDDDPYKTVWKNKKEFYRNQRDMSAFYLLGVYILGAIDAYVDAHLYDFSVEKNISLGLNADKHGSIGIRCSIGF